MNFLRISFSIGFCVQLLSLAIPAQAAPSATSSASFGSTVATSCTTQTNFTPKTYLPTGTGPSGGKKVLAANSTAYFDCNSDNVTVSANITTLDTPNFQNATNLNLRQGTGIGVDHLVTISVLQGGNQATLTSGLPENTVGPITLDENTSGTTADGDIQLNLVSVFTANTGGAEELAAGQYSTGINLTVTAQ
jgi:hypothetical protein